MKFRPRRPGYINDGETTEAPQEFSTLDELREVPQVKRFLGSGFTLVKSWTSSHPDIPETEHLLMAYLDEDYFYVIGYLSPADEVWETLDLPVWEARKNTK